MLRNFNPSLIGEEKKVLVGLSGGADSVCLLLNLLEYSDSHNISVSAIHCNHRLREAADADEAFCVSLCEKLGVTLFVETLDVRGYAEENGLSHEEAGRVLRYRAFEKHSDGGLVATAHNRGDTAETVIFNLARGTGLRGLCGIPERRGKIIRPMLSCPREEIENYLREKGQDFVTDETNLTDDYTRNKIRHRVVPVLKEINPLAEEHILTLSSMAKTDEDFLSGEAKKLLDSLSDGNSLDAEGLSAAHSALSSRAVALFLAENGIPVTARLVNEVLELSRTKKSSRINVGEDVYISLSRSRIYIGGERLYPEYSAPLSVGKNPFPGKCVTAVITEDEKSVKEAFVHRKFTNCHIDYDKIKGALLLRNKRQGDRISLVGRGFESRLKKLLEKIPSFEKDRIAVISDDEGIVFVEGFGAAERVALTQDTKRIMTFRIEVDINES